MRPLPGPTALGFRGPPSPSPPCCGPRCPFPPRFREATGASRAWSCWAAVLSTETPDTRSLRLPKARPPGGGRRKQVHFKPKCSAPGLAFSPPVALKDGHSRVRTLVPWDPAARLSQRAQRPWRGRDRTDFLAEGLGADPWCLLPAPGSRETGGPRAPVCAGVPVAALDPGCSLVDYLLTFTAECAAGAWCAWGGHGIPPAVHLSCWPHLCAMFLPWSHQTMD